MEYPYQTADPTLYHLLHEYAAYNRNHPTEAEDVLWEYLRASGLGKPFKRQHIIGAYIADFVCLESHLVIELDGGYHQLPDQKTSDAQRTAELNRMGFRVLRFTNEELFTNVNAVLETIESALFETTEYQPL